MDSPVPVSRAAPCCPRGHRLGEQPGALRTSDPRPWACPPGAFHIHPPRLQLRSPTQVEGLQSGGAGLAAAQKTPHTRTAARTPWRSPWTHPQPPESHSPPGSKRVTSQPLLEKAAESQVVLTRLINQRAAGAEAGPGPNPHPPYPQLPSPAPIRGTHGAENDTVKGWQPGPQLHRPRSQPPLLQRSPWEAELQIPGELLRCRGNRNEDASEFATLQPALQRPLQLGALTSLGVVSRKAARTIQPSQDRSSLSLDITSVGPGNFACRLKFNLKTVPFPGAVSPSPHAPRVSLRLCQHTAPGAWAGSPGPPCWASSCYSRTSLGGAHTLEHRPLGPALWLGLPWASLGTRVPTFLVPQLLASRGQASR